MQKTAHDVGAGHYRERLGPSLWTLVSAAVAGPMAALVFAPIDRTLALVVGAAVGVAVVALLIAGSPVVELRDGVLRAGRAHIDVGLLGDPVVFAADEARQQRGAGLDPRAALLPSFVGGEHDGIPQKPDIDVRAPRAQDPVAELHHR